MMVWKYTSILLQFLIQVNKNSPAVDLSYHVSDMGFHPHTLPSSLQCLHHQKPFHQRTFAHIDIQSPMGHHHLPHPHHYSLQETRTDSLILSQIYPMIKFEKWLQWTTNCQTNRMLCLLTGALTGLSGLSGSRAGSGELCITAGGRVYFLPSILRDVNLNWRLQDAGHRGICLKREAGYQYKCFICDYIDAKIRWWYI